MRATVITVIKLVPNRLEPDTPKEGRSQHTIPSHLQEPYLVQQLAKAYRSAKHALTDVVIEP